MSIFSHKNQHFRTSDLITLVVLCGVVSSIFGAILAQSFQDHRPNRARAGAEALALQIQAHNEAVSRSGARGAEQLSTHSVSDRGPASQETIPSPLLSAGKMGRDPWGRPFHYQVRSSSGVNETLIFVWSDGPNGQEETDTEKLTEQLPQSSSKLEQIFRFGGDDIGHIKVGKLTN